MPRGFYKHKLLLDENMPSRHYFPRLNHLFDVKHIAVDLKKGSIKDELVYEEAVKFFAPYDAIKDPNPSARAAGAALIRKGIAAGPQGKTFIFVNNRLEGNALNTIAAMIEQAEG